MAFFSSNVWVGNFIAYLNSQRLLTNIHVQKIFCVRHCFFLSLEPITLLSKNIKMVCSQFASYQKLLQDSFSWIVMIRLQIYTITMLYRELIFLGGRIHTSGGRVEGEQDFSLQINKKVKLWCVNLTICLFRAFFLLSYFAMFSTIHYNVHCTIFYF